jgi:hypothetical protein
LHNIRPDIQLTKTKSPVSKPRSATTCYTGPLDNVDLVNPEDPGNKQESKQRKFNVVTTGYFSIIHYNNNKINNYGNINDHDTIPDNPQ